MGILVYSFLWVLQNFLYHQPYTPQLNKGRLSALDP